MSENAERVLTCIGTGRQQPDDLAHWLDLSHADVALALVELLTAGAIEMSDDWRYVHAMRDGPPSEIDGIVKQLKTWAKALEALAEIEPTRENWEAFIAAQAAIAKLQDAEVWATRSLQNKAPA